MTANIIQRGVDSAEMLVVRESNDAAKREARRLTKKNKPMLVTPETQNANPLQPFSPTMLSRHRQDESRTANRLSSQSFQELQTTLGDHSRSGSVGDPSNNGPMPAHRVPAQRAKLPANIPSPNEQSPGQPAQQVAANASQQT
jgi:hypothetical protein